MKVLTTSFLGQLTIKADASKSPELELKYNGISLIHLDNGYFLQTYKARRPISQHEVPLALMTMGLEVIADNQFNEITVLDGGLGHYLRYNLHQIELGRIGSGKIILTHQDSGIHMNTQYSNGSKDTTHTFYEGSDFNYRLPVLLVEALGKLQPYESPADSAMYATSIF